MVSKRRLSVLIDKNSKGNLSRDEFNEIIVLLNDSEGFKALEEILDEYWETVTSTEMIQEEGRRSVGSASINHTQKGVSPHFFGIAASILMIVGITVYFIFNRVEEPSDVLYQTDYSSIEEFSLPDGSIVTLNANSKLFWISGWERSRKREVYLQGEAFFDIKHLDDNATFSVVTNDVSVVVLGTSFNVDSRGDKTEVFLKEGSVRLHLKDDLDEVITMMPGNKVKYSISEQRLELSEDESMLSSAAWKEGVLNFKNMEFREVLNELKDIYGKEFKCDDEALLSRMMYLGVPYANWDTLRQALELSLGIRIIDSEGIYLVEIE